MSGNIVVSQNMVRRLANDAFYALFPEFRVLRQVQTAAGRSCPKCARTKTEERRVAGFTAILKSLSAVRLTALKKHLGVAHITLRALNRATGKYEPRVI